jgi:Glycosyltransferase
MEQIRILQIIDELNLGGSEMMVMNLYRNINRNLFQFDFLINRKEEVFFQKEIEQLGGRVYYIPKLNINNIFKYKKYWDEFYRKHPYRIVHSHVRSTASIDLAIAKKYGAFTIAHSHSTSNGNGTLSLVKFFLQLPIRYIADYCASCSQQSGIWLYGRRILKSEKFKVISNGIDCDKFRFDIDKRNEFREKLKVSENFVIGHVGRIAYPKNHKFLINVFYKLSQTQNNISLLIVGDGELRGTLEAQVKELGLIDKVIFAGNVVNTNDYMQAMDLFVFPSHYEGLPVTLVEAQSSGLKCLVSDVITHEVFLTKEIEALPASNDSINKWVDKIKDCMNEHSVSNRVCGSELVEKTRFNVKKSVGELEKIYDI